MMVSILFAVVPLPPLLLLNLVEVALLFTDEAPKLAQVTDVFVEPTRLRQRQHQAQVTAGPCDVAAVVHRLWLLSAK